MRSLCWVSRRSYLCKLNYATFVKEIMPYGSPGRKDTNAYY